MAYMTTSELEEMFGAVVVDGLFTDSGNVNTSAQDRALATADARVRTALRTAGYVPPTDAQVAAWIAGSDEEAKAQGYALQHALAGAWLRIAAGRKQREIPEEYRDAIWLVRKIEKGEITFPALTSDDDAGIASIESSSRSTTLTTGRPQVFDRNMGR